MISVEKCNVYFSRGGFLPLRESATPEGAGDGGARPRAEPHQAAELLQGAAALQATAFFAVLQQRFRCFATKLMV